MDVKRSLLFVRDTESVPEFLAYVVRKLVVILQAI